MEKKHLLILVALMLTVAFYGGCGNKNDEVLKEVEQEMDRALNPDEFMEAGQDSSPSESEEENTSEGENLPTAEELAVLEDIELPVEDGEDVLLGDITNPEDPSVAQLKVINQAVEDLEKAKKQKETDPELAKLTIAHVLSTISYVERNKSEDLLPEVDASLTVLRSDAEMVKDQLDKVAWVDQPLLVADLSEKFPEDLRGGALLDDKLYVYTDKYLVSSLDPAFASAEKFDLPPDAVIVSATAFPYGKGIVLGLSNGKLVEFANGELSFPEVTNQQWGRAQQVLHYDQRRFIYVLDPAANQVWKYGRGASSYQSPTASLTTDVDIQDATSIAIDGNIFVLKSNGQILRYLHGAKRTDFIIKNPPTTLMSGDMMATKMVTEEAHRHVYVLDRKYRAVHVYTKDTFANTRALIYDKQYRFNEDIIDILVSADESTLYLIGPHKIFRVAMATE